MNNKIEKAVLKDYDEVMDLTNYVFSHHQGTTDFPAMLPKLYKRENFMDNIHYIVREGGRIKAVVGAYSLEWEFKEQKSLPGRGIGMVSVHPYSRSRGYMKDLMNAALEDMKKDGMVFSCLNGQRQRYEYFGFNPAGIAYTFICSKRNIRHTLGHDWKSSLSIKPVGQGDEKILDSIQALHEAKPARLRRQREGLFDILSSWHAKAYAIMEGERFEGYFVVETSRAGDQRISEVNLFDLSRLTEVIGLFLDQGAKESLRIHSGPQETEKLSVLSRFCESYAQSPAFHFAIFDYKRFTEPFLKMASSLKTLADGSFFFQINGGLLLRLVVKQGLASLEEGPGASVLKLNNIEALHFLFSPLTAVSLPAIRENTFLQSLLPLPLSYEGPDAI